MPVQGIGRTHKGLAKTRSRQRTRTSPGLLRLCINRGKSCQVFFIGVGVRIV